MRCRGGARKAITTSRDAARSVRDGGGVLLTQAIHSLDLFRSLVGVSEVIRSDVRTTDLHRMETEDLVDRDLALGERRRRDADGDDGRLSGLSRTHRNHRHQRIRVADRRDAADVLPRRPRKSSVEAEGKTGSGASIMDFPARFPPRRHRRFPRRDRDNREPLVSGEEALASQRLVADILAAGAP